MKGKAVIYTQDKFVQNYAKTAHGLIRGSERYEVVAVIDRAHAGQEAGTLLDGEARAIPIFGDLQAWLETGSEAKYFIIGIANTGGILDRAWFPTIKAAIHAGMDIVCGMHESMAEIPEIADLARARGVKLIDVRRPKRREDLHFWTGEIREVTCPIVPVLGTDCAVGKRTTAKMLVEAFRARGKKAEMIYTGQTGWMQGWNYGFMFDATLNDFVSGELEHAIVTCFRQEKPDIIFVEGQAALRNPSGPCGSEFLVSGGATGVILVHAPARTFHKGWDKMNKQIASVASEITLIEAYDVPVQGMALNTMGMESEEAKAFQASYRAQFGLPVVLPVEEGVEDLLEIWMG
ncbi:MAG: DUF1611 domain-containing protein [Bacteroidota bacterium]